MLRATCRFLMIGFLALLLAAPTAADKKKTGPSDPLADLSLNALAFRGIGPALTSGRISDFAVNPDNPKEYFVATSSGGVWKTTTAGTSFTPVFDSQGSYSIGCVTMAAQNHNLIWVGTGENNNQRSVAYGDGVYKSEDGGKSWKNMGLKSSEHIGRIVIDPRDSEHVFVAAYGPLWSAGGERGLYRTVDGGETWQAVLTISEHTGVSEVFLDPRDPDLIYAVAHQRRRHVFTLIDGGPESAVYRSKDGGESWDKLSGGLPQGDVGRIGLAISPVDPDVVFAIVEAAPGRGGFFRSTDRGSSWEKRSSYHSSGNYYQEILCDPVDIDRVYSMDTFLQVTDDGGETWRALGERSKHWDNHAMWINPADPDYYLVGGDGGVYESFDRGRTWKFMTNLPVTQFYKVAVDEAVPFYFIYGGTQDNYSLGGPSRTTSAHGIVTSDWFTTVTGDGFESAIDPDNPDIVYAQSQHGNLMRFDKRSGERMGIQPKPRKGEAAYVWNWDAPLLVSAHKPGRIYFAANKVFRSDDRGDTWQVISKDLSRKIDRNTLEVMGRVWPMDAVAKNASTSQYGAVVALDESPLDENLIIAGTDDGLIQITENGGEAWTRVERFPGVPERTYVNEVLASRHERGTIFAAFNNHKNGDFKPYVMKSVDAGESWASIAEGLPERGSVYALEQDHVDPDLLFAGTEFGCFTSIDGGAHWKQLKAGLPTIAVRDIAIQRRENDLVLATFGRGFYVLDDYTPLRGLKPEILAREGHIFPIKDAWMFVEAYPLGGLGSKERGFQGEMFFSAPNPPLGAVFFIHLKDSIKTTRDLRREEERTLAKDGKPVPYPSAEQLRAEESEETPFLLLTIRDEEGRVVRRLRAPAAAGLQRVVWDLRYPDLAPTREGLAGALGNGPSSTWALPGAYTVSLSKVIDGEESELAGPQPFQARTLGHAVLPAADRAQLAAFQKEVRELNHAVNSAGAVLRELYARTRHYRAALKSVTVPTGDLIQKIRTLEAELREIQTAFRGDRIRMSLDLDVKPGLARQIGGIIGEQWQSTSAPTQTQRDTFAAASEALAPLLERISALLQGRVAEIEARLNEVGAPYTPGRPPDWKK